MNNLAKYHVVIELLIEALINGVSQIKVYLYSELVVYQLNWVNTIRNLLLLRMFRRVWILERYFEFISYQHIPIHLNAMDDSITNYVLDWYLAHV